MNLYLLTLASTLWRSPEPFFFPTDAQRPNSKVEGFDVVKKIVIKIKVAE